MNKVNVAKNFGSSATLGYCDPIVGMTTNMGDILSLDSGNSTVIVGMGSGDFQQRFNPQYLYVTDTEATSEVAWPTGVGCVKFGHANTLFTNAVGSGTAYYSGDNTVHIFGR